MALEALTGRAPSTAQAHRARHRARTREARHLGVARTPPIVPWANGLILGYLMYRPGLVPRRRAWFGLIGGPLLLVGNFGVLFDGWDQPRRVVVAPKLIWEAFLGIYCAIWGFRRDSRILCRSSPAS